MTVCRDAVFETNETFTVGLSSPVGSTILDGSGLGTIENDDAAPSFTIDNVSHNEGNSGTTSYVFTVTKTGATEVDATVAYATANGSAVAPDDYTALPTTT